MNELLPCPFCGSKEELLSVEKKNGDYFVWCLNCGGSSGFDFSTEKATEKWNERRN